MSSHEFIQKTNEWIHFYCYATCFCSFFGRNWRHQKNPFEITWPLVRAFFMGKQMRVKQATFLLKCYVILFFLEMNILTSAYESTLSFKSLDLCMYPIMYLPIIHVCKWQVPKPSFCIAILYLTSGQMYIVLINHLCTIFTPSLQIYTVFNCVHFPLQSRCTVYIFYDMQSNVEITLKKL